MATQIGKNVVVSYKLESVFNTPVSGAGATRLRCAPGNGLTLKRTQLTPSEFRSDGQLPMARLGHKSVDGAYSGDLAVDEFNAFIAAVLRSAFDADLTITQATAGLTSITTTTTTIVASAGSWITAGLKLGDYFRMTGHSTAANNSKNLGPITALTATVLTLPSGQLTADAVADTSFSIVRPKKCINAATFTRASFTIEEYYSDLDDSQIFSGCRVSGMKFTFPADGMVKVEVRFIGADMSVPGGASAPTFTSPTLSSTVALSAIDASIRFASGAITTLTSAEIDVDLGAAGLSVIGSQVTPDVFESACKVTVNLTGMKTDMTNVSAFLAETEADLSILCVEPEAEPKSFVSFYVPRVKRLGADAGIGQDGAMTETVPCYAAIAVTATNADSTTLAVQSAP